MSEVTVVVHWRCVNKQSLRVTNRQVVACINGEGTLEHFVPLLNLTGRGAGMMDSSPGRRGSDLSRST